MSIIATVATLLLATLVSSLLFLYVYYKHAYSYWKKRNVPTIPTRPIVGNLQNPFNTLKSAPMQFTEMYEEFRKMGVEKAGGVYMFASPQYIPMDLDIIKLIITKDYHHFNSRGVFVSDHQATSQHLFSLSGDTWKKMREKLSPTFTSGKMKMMYNTVLACSHPLIAEVAKGNAVNIKRAAVRFSTDVIGSCAFGIDCNSFENDETDFIKYARMVVQPTNWEVMRDIVSFALPNVAKRFNFNVFDPAVDNFFSKLVEEVVEYRDKNNVTRKDFMQLLIELRNGKNVDEESVRKFGGAFTLDMMIAQSFVFFIAGFETSSSAMTFCLYELSLNQEVQEKARSEIFKVLKKFNGDCCYEAIMEMKYLTQVVEETLRLHPSVPMLTRRCTETYKLPDSDLVIEKGTNVVIAIYAMQRDPRYFPDPLKFDPDRFSDENKTNRNSYCYMPFGEGPRICIGMRFGMMQAKIGLVSLLTNYKFTLNEKTKTPLEYTSTFLLSAKDDIWLNKTKVNPAEYDRQTA